MAEEKKALILGAGALAEYLVEYLVARKIPTSILIRNPARVDKYKSLGAEVILGEVTNTPVLKSALKGIHTVISVIGNFTDPAAIQQQNSIIDILVASGVHHFIPSIFTVHREILGDLIGEYMQAKYDSIAKTKKSGLSWTVFYTGAFTETWTGPQVGFDASNGKVVIPADGQNVIPWIGYKDVAQYVALSIFNPLAVNKEFDLVTENVTYNEVVSIFEKAANKKFDVKYKSIEELHADYAASKTESEKGVVSIIHAIGRVQSYNIDILKETFPDFKTTETLQNAANKLFNKQ